MARSAPWWQRVLPVLSLVLWLGTGCGAATPGFAPVVARSATGAEGPYTAAEYSLDGEGQGNAAVRVWSRGAYREQDQGAARTVVHVGFAVDNHGTTPLRLDERRLLLEDVALADGMLYRVAPSRVEGNLPVAPGESAQVQAYFTLQRRVWPGDVFGYRVAWSMEGAGSSSAEHTAFRSRSLRWQWAGYYPDYSGYAWYSGYPWYPGYAGGWYSPWGAYPNFGPRRYWVSPRINGMRLYPPRVLARPRP